MSDSEVLARIRAICVEFPDVQEGLLQERPLFHVRRRRFAIFNGTDAPPRRRWAGFGPSLHFATDPREHAAMQSDPRFRASPHHGFRGWMALELQPCAIDWPEITRLVEAAYRQVAGRELVATLDARRE